MPIDFPLILCYTIITVIKELTVMKKIYNFLLTINVWFLVLGAILTVVNSPLGSFVFLYTCIIGMIDAVKTNNFNGKVVNGALGGMNIYYCVVTIMSLV